MCGIGALFGIYKGLPEQLKAYYDLIEHRGPDDFNTFKVTNTQTTLFFYRLKIIGMDTESSQPLMADDGKLSLICNGEIYNYKELIEKYDLPVITNSDCEVILHLYKKFGIKRTLDLLHGEFAFIITDCRVESYKQAYIARDPIGIRPLFQGFYEEDKNYAFCSEAKSLTKFCKDITQFQPGSYLKLTSHGIDNKWTKHSTYKYYDMHDMCWLSNEQTYSIKPDDSHMKNIKKLVVNAVKMRLTSDREIAVCLSGGLDSSLVASITKRHTPYIIKSFAIGLSDSPDLLCARKVATQLKTEHHEAIFTIQEGIDSLANVIYQIESYDTTTVRASVPMWLLGKFVKETTDVRVLLTGEGPDETIPGYLYLNNAPCAKELQEETERLTNDLHYFDVLRCDRTISGHGIESRVPFLDKMLVNYIMSISPEEKEFKNNHGIEKYLLRKAFDTPDDPYLSKEILWRPKEAFSDGVGYGWVDGLIDYAEKTISDELLKNAKIIYPDNTPLTKEAYLYREIYSIYYDHKPIPYYWLPRWSEHNNNPSARVLNIHKEKISKTI